MYQPDWAYARSCLLRKTDDEDLVHDALLRVMKNVNKGVVFECIEKFVAYLNRALQFCLADLRHKQSIQNRHRGVVYQFRSMMSFGASPSPDERAIMMERHAILRAAISKLTPRRAENICGAYSLEHPCEPRAESKIYSAAVSRAKDDLYAMLENVLS